MNDNFFNKTHCDRCGKSLENGFTMSMYNEDAICMDCKEKETKRSDYDQVSQKDMDDYLSRHGIKKTYKIIDKN